MIRLQILQRRRAFTAFVIQRKSTGTVAPHRRRASGGHPRPPAPRQRRPPWLPGFPPRADCEGPREAGSPLSAKSPLPFFSLLGSTRDVLGSREQRPIGSGCPSQKRDGRAGPSCRNRSHVARTCRLQQRLDMRPAAARVPPGGGCRRAPGGLGVATSPWTAQGPSDHNDARSSSPPSSSFFFKICCFSCKIAAQIIWVTLSVA